MNIIRTKAIELDTIPAIAYKIKLASGGSGIKMHRTDCDDTVFTTIDKRSGGAVLDEKVNPSLFPEAAFDEAVDALAGMPYSARGKVKIVHSSEKEAEEIIAEEMPEEELQEAVDMVGSAEFTAIIDRYSDENGKINYQLMNKQFIQFAAGSKVVSDMVGKKDSVENIILFIVKNRAAYLAGKKEFVTDEEAAALIRTIDEIDPRSAFKELSLHLRKMLSKK